MRVEKAAMIRVLHEEAAFSEMFISHLLERTLRVEELGKEGRPEPITAKISQETLAELIGTIRSAREFLYEEVSKIGFD
jgi:CRP/FNR family transcriptional regulator, cyclic AMP receptor protein